jgi:hypothetical protein
MLGGPGAARCDPSTFGLKERQFAGDEFVYHVVAG